MASGNIENSQGAEIILAQEQSVTCKSALESEFQGSLVLTNKRLLFVAADQEEDLPFAKLRFADVKELDKIPRDPANLSLTFNEMEVERGHEGIFGPPTSKIKWMEKGRERKVEFVEEVTGGRKKDLKDWAKVIEALKNGSMNIQIPSSLPPDANTLEGRILSALNDMQEKGVFEIEKEIEDSYGIQNVDPDEIEAACKKLTSEGFLDEINDASGDNFYRKRSPLGQDDLSS